MNLIKSIPLNYYQDVVLGRRSKNPRLLSLNVRSVEQDYQGTYLIYLQTHKYFLLTLDNSWEYDIPFNLLDYPCNLEYTSNFIDNPLPVPRQYLQSPAVSLQSPRVSFQSPRISLLSPKKSLHTLFLRNPCQNILIP